MSKSIVINPVTRIEGHARIVLDLDDAGEVLSGHLQVLELRGFEKLLEGTELFKMPQITARLCGVCPAAHHLAAVAAIENGLGVEAPPAARRLRQILYAGHILHSHALSTFVLAGPDLLLGLDAKPEMRNVFAMLALDAELVKKVLRLRSLGQRTVELVGGRGVHPVTAIPGGMSARPSDDKLSLIAGWGEESGYLIREVGPVVREKLSAMADIAAVAQLPFRSVALSMNDAVEFLDGDLVARGPDGAEERRFAATDYADHLIEHVAAGSHMKSVRLRGPEEQQFFVGPLARLNVSSLISTPGAQEALDEFRAAGVPRSSALDFIAARMVEMLHCTELMRELASGDLSGPLRVPVTPPGEGHFVGVIEAPRGILVHDYETGADGRVANVNFLVATQNNYDAIDHAITALARRLRPIADDNHFMNGVEFALRCFDPCLACATHAAGRMPMTIDLRQGGKVVRTISREVAR